MVWSVAVVAAMSKSFPCSLIGQSLFNLQALEVPTAGLCPTPLTPQWVFMLPKSTSPSPTHDASLIRGTGRHRGITTPKRQLFSCFVPHLGSYTCQQCHIQWKTSTQQPQANVSSLWVVPNVSAGYCFLFNQRTHDTTSKNPHLTRKCVIKHYSNSLALLLKKCTLDVKRTQNVEVALLKSLMLPSTYVYMIVKKGTAVVFTLHVVFILTNCHRPWWMGGLHNMSQPLADHEPLGRVGEYQAKTTEQRRAEPK